MFINKWLGMKRKLNKKLKRLKLSKEVRLNLFAIIKKGKRDSKALFFFISEKAAKRYGFERVIGPGIKKELLKYLKSVSRQLENKTYRDIYSFVNIELFRWKPIEIVAFNDEYYFDDKEEN